jgi:hypothetical protein
MRSAGSAASWILFRFSILDEALVDGTIYQEVVCEMAVKALQDPNIAAKTKEKPRQQASLPQLGSHVYSTFFYSAQMIAFRFTQEMRKLVLSYIEYTYSVAPNKYRSLCSRNYITLHWVLPTLICSSATKTSIDSSSLSFLVLRFEFLISSFAQLSIILSDVAALSS